MIRGKNVYEVYKMLLIARDQRKYYGYNDLIESVFILAQ